MSKFLVQTDRSFDIICNNNSLISFFLRYDMKTVNVEDSAMCETNLNKQEMEEFIDKLIAMKDLMV